MESLCVRSMRVPLWLLLMVGAGTTHAGDPGQATITGSLQRDFVVYLNDRRVGTHRFEVLAADGKPSAVNSVARFDVKILGIRAYRYRHQAQEQWRDGCLVSLKASTDDNGARTQIDAASSSSLLKVSNGPHSAQLTGCVLTYAYWRRDFLQQQQLLNPQTGKYDPIEAQLLGRETITVGKSSVPADRYRVRAAGRSIDVWYSPSGEWLQLDSAIADGQTLRYRLP